MFRHLKLSKLSKPRKSSQTHRATTTRPASAVAAAATLALAMAAGTASATDPGANFGVDTETEYQALRRALRGAEYVRSDYLTDARAPRVYGVVAATLAFAERNPLATDAQLQSFLAAFDTALRAHAPGDENLRNLGELFAAVRFTMIDDPALAGLDTAVGSRALALLGVRVPDADDADNIGRRMADFEIQTARSLRFRAEIADLLVRAFMGQDAAGADRPALAPIVSAYLAAQGLDPALDEPSGRPDLAPVTAAIDTAMPPTYADFQAARDQGFPVLSAMLTGAIDATADQTDLVIADIRSLADTPGPGLAESIELTQTDPAAAQAILQQLRDELAALNDERATASAISLLMLQNPPPGVGTAAEFERARGVAVFEANAAGNATRSGLELAGNIGLTALAAINEDALSTAAGLFSAGLALDDLFGLSGQDDINEALETISMQISQLRDEMNARFDRIDAQLNLLYTATLEGLDRLDDIGADVDQIAQDMSATRSALRRVEAKLFGLLEAFFSSVFNTTVNQALARFDDNGTLLDFASAATNFIDTAAYLQTFATGTARTLAGSAAAPFDIDDADELFGPAANPTGAGELPFAPMLNEFAAVPTQLGLPPLRSSPVPAIEPWTQAASAYAQLMRENPWYFARTYGLQLADYQNGGSKPEILTLRDGGLEITSLLASIRATDAAGESPLFEALFAEYADAAAEVQTQIDLVIAQSYTGPEMSQYTNGATTVDFWGTDAQNIAPLAPTLDGIRIELPFLGERTLAFSNAPDKGYRTFAQSGGAGNADIRQLQLYTLLKRARIGAGFRVWGTAENTFPFLQGRAIAWIGTENAQASALVTRTVDFLGVDGNGDFYSYFSPATAAADIGNAWINSNIRSVYPAHRDAVAPTQFYCTQTFGEPFPDLCINQVYITGKSTSIDRAAVRRETRRIFAEIRAEVLAPAVLLALADDGAAGGTPSPLAAAAQRLDDIETLLDAYISLGMPDALAGSDAIRSALRAAPGTGELGLRAADLLVLVDEIRRSDLGVDNRWADAAFSLRAVDDLLTARMDTVAGEIRLALEAEPVAPAYLRWSIAELDALMATATRTAAPDAFVATAGRTLTVDAEFATDPARGFEYPVTGLLANDAEADRRPLTVDPDFGPGDAGFTPPTNGTVTIHPDGSFAYTPNPGFTGTDAFTYRAQTTFDGVTVTGDPATVLVRVDAPDCPADLAPPLGTLDLADISAFVAAFTAQDPLADLDANGVYDLTDIADFVAAFQAGCP